MNRLFKYFDGIAQVLLNVGVLLYRHLGYKYVDLCFYRLDSGNAVS